MEHLLGTCDQGHEGTRQTLPERVQGVTVDLPYVQWSSSDRRWSGDSLDIAARLAWGGTMRILGDVLNSVER